MQYREGIKIRMLSIAAPEFLGTGLSVMAVSYGAEYNHVLFMSAFVPPG